MINPDINKARTLPSYFYRNEIYFKQLRERAFRNNWNFAGAFTDDDEINVKPVTILEGLIDEPVVLTRGKTGETHCLSNVCTHRGSIVVDEPGQEMMLRCKYHGRCFGLNGRFRSMPGFEDVEGFPSEADNLARITSRAIGPMQFLRLDGDVSWESRFAAILDSMSWIDHDVLTYRPACSRDYFIDAHWALYVENYLEGFHVPFVHPGLNKSLEVEAYEVDLFDGGALQIGVANENESALIDIPPGTRFDGQRIYALYWWLFPNLMFNYYPWGISLNVVEPVTGDKTRVRFLTFAYRDLPDPDVSGLHQTELEDERVVESVARGMRSSFYETGRYSPKHERAVHHFHRMLAGVVGDGGL